MCARCGLPHGGDWRRKFCLPCAPDAERERARRAYMARQPKVCNECGVNPRPYKCAFCLPCTKIRDDRSHRRTRTRVLARYLAGRGGDVRAAYLERTRPKRLAQMRAYYVRHRPLTPIVRCQTELCTATFPASRGNRRKFCVECVRVFYGPRKARARAA